MVHRVSDSAHESVQQVASGLSRLQLELPQVAGSYQPFQRQTAFEPLHEAPYIHPGIMVNWRNRTWEGHVLVWRHT